MQSFICKDESAYSSWLILRHEEEHVLSCVWVSALWGQNGGLWLGNKDPQGSSKSYWWVKLCFTCFYLHPCRATLRSGCTVQDWYVTCPTSQSCGQSLFSSLGQFVLWSHESLELGFTSSTVCLPEQTRHSWLNIIKWSWRYKSLTPERSIKLFPQIIFGEKSLFPSSHLINIWLAVKF